MVAGSSVVEGGDGRLEDTPCADLVRSLAGSTFSGVVTLSDDHSEGRMWWREGCLMDAQWGNLGGYAAMYALVRRKAGVYRVEPGEVEASEPFDEDVEAFLTECLRRASLADELRAKLPDTGARLRVDLYHPHLLRMGIDVTGLLEVFHRGATVEQALAVSGLGELETLQILLILTRAGALEEADAVKSMTVTREESGARTTATQSAAYRRQAPALGASSPDVTRGRSRVIALISTGALAVAVALGIAFGLAPREDAAPAGGVAPEDSAPREAALVPDAASVSEASHVGAGTAGEGGVEAPEPRSQASTHEDPLADAVEAQGPAESESESESKSGSEPESTLEPDTAPVPASAPESETADRPEPAPSASEAPPSERDESDAPAPAGAPNGDRPMVGPGPTFGPGAAPAAPQDEGPLAPASPGSSDGT